jgi:L-galactose dehydrogenase
MSDTSLVEFMDFFTSRRMHVILASVLSMGLLSPKGPQSWHPAPQPLKEACRSVRELCAKADADVARMALRWSLQNLPTGISCVLVGFANEREVMDAMTVRDHREEKEDTALVEQCLHILSKVNETDRVWPSGLHQS